MVNKDEYYMPLVAACNL